MKKTEKNRRKSRNFTSDTNMLLIFKNNITLKNTEKIHETYWKF